jgi:hypothetical protein
MCVAISLGILSEENWSSPLLLGILLIICFSLSLSIAISLADSELSMNFTATGLANLIGLVAIIGLFFQTSWANSKSLKVALAQNIDEKKTDIKLGFYNSLVAWTARLYEVQSKLIAASIGPEVHFTLILQYNRAAGPPATTVEDMYKYHENLGRITSEGIGLLESWRVIDPRMEVFQVAISACSKDIRQAFDNYQNSALVCLSMDNDAKAKWTAPRPDQITALNEAAYKLRDVAITLGAYVSDLKLEMQNALIGNLFNTHREDYRNPLEQGRIVISLDRAEEVMRHFQTKSSESQAS